MLFKVQRNPESGKQFSLLGDEFVEVIGIEPWALANPDEDYEEWCYKTIKCEYICNTHGLVKNIHRRFLGSYRTVR